MLVLVLTMLAAAQPAAAEITFTGEIGGWVSATEVATAGSRWTDVRNPFLKEAR